MALLVKFTEMALQNRPELAEAPPDQPSSERIRVLRLTDVRAMESEDER